MAQLFDNLINNALKYQTAVQQPFIKVCYTTVQEEKDLVKRNFHKITVADNGIRFRADQTEKIFQLFQRLNTRQNYSGTGIGLAICKKIVENQHGLITADGKENEGAQFHIYLPV